MDESPFPPATPIHLGDEDERLNATIRAIRRRRTTRAGAGAAVAVVAAAIAVPLLVPGSSPGNVNVAGGLPCGSAASAAGAASATGATGATGATASTACPAPTTTVTAAAPPTTTGSTDVTATTAPPLTAPATIPPATGPAPTAPTTVPPKTTTTNAGRPATSGVVTDSSGRPVAGAYVIGLNNLAVARTDARGHYSMACVDQKLVAAAWLLPVMTAGPGGSGGFSYGVNTTNYGPPPGTPGPGYVFSGGASDVTAATRAGCGGTLVNFRLPAGGTVDITWTSRSTPPGTDVGPTTTDPDPSVSAGPIDNLYLPGLGTQAALETDLATTNNQQIVAQLGAGTLRIDGVSTPFTCSGPGVAGSGAVWTVPVEAGKTTSVTCVTS